MESKPGVLEDDFPCQLGDFQVPAVNFSGASRFQQLEPSRIFKGRTSPGRTRTVPYSPPLPFFSGTQVAQHVSIQGIQTFGVVNDYPAHRVHEISMLYTYTWLIFMVNVQVRYSILGACGKEFFSSPMQRRLQEIDGLIKTCGVWQWRYPQTPIVSPNWLRICKRSFL